MTTTNDRIDTNVLVPGTKQGNTQTAIRVGVRNSNEVPHFTYSIGHVRPDFIREGETFYAPYVRHEDIPAVIAELQKVYDENEKARAAAHNKSYQEEAAKHGSWKHGTSRQDKKLRRIANSGHTGDDSNHRAEQNSKRARQEGLRTFRAA